MIEAGAGVDLDPLADVPEVARGHEHRAIAGAVPMVLSVGLEASGVWDPGNVVRCVTGGIFGAVMAGLVVRALATVDYQRA